MKKWMLRLSFAFVFLFVGIVIGMSLLSHARPGLNAVVVNVHNSTNDEIKKIVITHKKGTEEVCNISSKKDQQIAFFPGGEDSYLIKVFFKNGKKIESVGGYVEPGYSMRHEITKEGITTEYDFSNTNP